MRLPLPEDIPQPPAGPPDSVDRAIRVAVESMIPGDTRMEDEYAHNEAYVKEQVSRSIREGTDLPQEAAEAAKALGPGAFDEIYFQELGRHVAELDQAQNPQIPLEELYDEVMKKRPDQFPSPYAFVGGEAASAAFGRRFPEEGTVEDRRGDPGEQMRADVDKKLTQAELTGPAAWMPGLRPLPFDAYEREPSVNIPRPWEINERLDALSGLNVPFGMRGRADEFIFFPRPQDFTPPKSAADIGRGWRFDDSPKRRL